MMLVKMMIDMPLPIPRAVMSSPIHMTTTAPAVSVTTMITPRTGFRSGSSALVPEQEHVAHRCASAKPTVR